jgi:hypothetical protein
MWTLDSVRVKQREREREREKLRLSTIKERNAKEVTTIYCKF